MSQNFIKRFVTSIILLLLLFFINFAHQNIFIIAILTLGMIICAEVNNLFSKLLFTKNFKKKHFLINLISNFLSLIF